MSKYWSYLDSSPVKVILMSSDVNMLNAHFDLAELKNGNYRTYGIVYDESVINEHDTIDQAYKEYSQWVADLEAQLLESKMKRP